MHGYSVYSAFARDRLDTERRAVSLRSCSNRAAASAVLFSEFGNPKCPPGSDRASGFACLDEERDGASTRTRVDRSPARARRARRVLVVLGRLRPALATLPPFDHAPHELRFGIVRADGSYKPVAQTLARHCRARRATYVDRARRRSSDEAAHYAALPDEHRGEYRGVLCTTCLTTRAMIVTGASSGIGRALALAAARARLSRVLLVARRADRLDEVAREIRAAGGTVRDACRRRHRAATRRRASWTPAMRAFGRIDVVVNNAGARRATATLLGAERRRDRSAVAARTSPRRCASRAPRFRSSSARTGQLVFVGSGVARVPIPHYGAYAAAKAGDSRRRDSTAPRTARARHRGHVRRSGTRRNASFTPRWASSARTSVRPPSPERVARSDPARHRAPLRRRQRASRGKPPARSLGEWFGTLADPSSSLRLTPSRAATSEHPQRSAHGAAAAGAGARAQAAHALRTSAGARRAPHGAREAAAGVPARRTGAGRTRSS